MLLHRFNGPTYACATFAYLRDGRYANPCRNAMAAAAVRDGTSSLARTLATCVMAVRWLMNSTSPISLSLLPWARRRSTSRSRLVSVAAPRGIGSVVVDGAKDAGADCAVVCSASVMA